MSIKEEECFLCRWLWWLLTWLLCVSRLVHEVKVSGMKRHKLEIQSTDSSNPDTDNFRLIVVRSRTPRTRRAA